MENGLLEKSPRPDGAVREVDMSINSHCCQGVENVAPDTLVRRGAWGACPPVRSQRTQLQIPWIGQVKLGQCRFQLGQDSTWTCRRCVIQHSTICRQFFESKVWALIPQNFIPLPRHVEDFEVEDKASVSRLGKVEEEGLYPTFEDNQIELIGMKK